MLPSVFNPGPRASTIFPDVKAAAAGVLRAPPGKKAARNICRAGTDIQQPGLRTLGSMRFGWALRLHDRVLQYKISVGK
jgi:hypothetical protein